MSRANADTATSQMVTAAEHEFLFSSLPPTLAQERLALGMVLVMAGAFLIVEVSLSTVRVPRVEAFVPAYDEARRRWSTATPECWTSVTHPRRRSA